MRSMLQLASVVKCPLGSFAGCVMSVRGCVLVRFARVCAGVRARVCMPGCMLRLRVHCACSCSLSLSRCQATCPCSPPETQTTRSCTTEEREWGEWVQKRQLAERRIGVPMPMAMATMALAAITAVQVEKACWLW